MREKRVKGFYKKLRLSGNQKGGWSRQPEKRGWEQKIRASHHSEPKSKAKKENLRLVPIFKALSGKSKDG
jgi:hypothetical protein